MEEIKMYKKQLKNMVQELVSEGIFQFKEYSEIMKNIEIITEEDAKKIVEDYAPKRKTVSSVIGAVYSVPVPYIVYKLIRAAFNKCNSACGTFALNTPKRQICTAKCNVIRLEKILAIQKKNKVDSSDTEEKLSKWKNILSKYQSYAVSTGRNPNPKVDPDKESLFKIPG
jgi:hypothetical protein